MMAANQNTQILKYIESCTSQNNPDRQQLSIDNEGRKKQICMYFCEAVVNATNFTLNDKQTKFLKSLTIERD